MNVASAKTTGPNEPGAAANSILQKNSGQKDDLRMAAHRPGLAHGRQPAVPNRTTRETARQRSTPPCQSMPDEAAQATAASAGNPGRCVEM